MRWTNDVSDGKFDWMEANGLLRVRMSNAEDCKIVLPSCWNLDLLEELLSGYEDQDVIKYLRYG